MNANRRKRIKDVISQIQDIISDIESIKDEEQDVMDNTPENLQGSQRYCDMEEYVDSMDEAISSLEEACNSLESIIWWVIYMERKSLYVVKFNNSAYYDGIGNTTTQLKNAKIYSSEKYANEAGKKMINKYSKLTNYNLIESEIKEVE